MSHTPGPWEFAPDLLNAAENALEALETACEFLANGTPINNGSDLHTDMVAFRDQLRHVTAKAKGGGQ